MMKTQSDKSALYRLVRPRQGGRSKFISDIDDDDTRSSIRDCPDHDLVISLCYFTAPELSATRVYPLYFQVTSQDSETTRTSALQAYQYISERFEVPDDGIELFYTQDRGLNHDNKHGASSSKMTILVPPAVFSSQPTTLMPALNYHLARQMVRDGIENLNIDVYERDHFVRLPNSANSATGRFVIPLSWKELLYLDGHGISELAKQPKPEDSLIAPRPALEAAEWYAETLAEFETQHRWQDELRKIVLDNGWEVPPCIRQLMRLRLYDHNRLEAYRTLSQFLSWIKAGPAEIRHVIEVIDRRNPLQDFHRKNAIIAYAVENPWFVGCRHPLLQQFCASEGCFLSEIIRSYEAPLLFQSHHLSPKGDGTIN